MRIHAGSTGDNVDGRQQRWHWAAPCGSSRINVKQILVRSKNKCKTVFCEFADKTN